MGFPPEFQRNPAVLLLRARGLGLQLQKPHIRFLLGLLTWLFLSWWGGPSLGRLAVIAIDPKALEFTLGRVLSAVFNLVTREKFLVINLRGRGG
jgi:hypothetical protein